METNGGDPREVVQQLKAREPMGLKNPVRVRDPAMTNRIADLKLHPSIECGLHMLNDDIVSAHFLVRQCQGRDLTDYWHGILHRIENDFRNSRLWYQNAIKTELVERFHDSPEAAQQFVWDCQNVVVDKNSKNLDVTKLKQKAMDEMLGLLDIAIAEFGLEARADVSEYYSSREVRLSDLGSGFVAHKKGDKELKGKMTSGQVKREGRENE